MTNIEKLARLIVRTGNADKIMLALALTVRAGALKPMSTASAKKGGADA